MTVPPHFAFYPSSGPPERVWVVFPTDHDDPVLWTRPCPFPVPREEGALVRYRLDPDPDPPDRPRPDPGLMEPDLIPGLDNWEARPWRAKRNPGPVLREAGSFVAVALAAIALGIAIGVALMLAPTWLMS